MSSPRKNRSSCCTVPRLSVTSCSRKSCGLQVGMGVHEDGAKDAEVATRLKVLGQGEPSERGRAKVRNKNGIGQAQIKSASSGGPQLVRSPELQSPCCPASPQTYRHPGPAHISSKRRGKKSLWQDGPRISQASSFRLR